jgi:peptidoglycan/xylan/chitin deacetylase (PgdA/CDA1 family)
MWNIDTLDWKYRDPATIVDLAAQQIAQQGRGIILMHDIHTQTTLALPHIIQTLSDRNATVVQIQPR